MGFQRIITVLISALIKPHLKPVYSTQHNQGLFIGAAVILSSISACVKQVFYSYFAINVENTSKWLGASQFPKNQKIYLCYYIYIYIYIYIGRSQWPCGLRGGSTAAHMLGLWFRIPRGAWKSACVECCVLSCRGLCDGLITRPEEAYPLFCVVVCDLETSWMRRPWPVLGRSPTGDYIYIYIYRERERESILTYLLYGAESFLRS